MHIAYIYIYLIRFEDPDTNLSLQKNRIGVRFISRNGWIAQKDRISSVSTTLLKLYLTDRAVGGVAAGRAGREVVLDDLHIK